MEKIENAGAEDKSQKSEVRSRNLLKTNFQFPVQDARSGGGESLEKTQLILLRRVVPDWFADELDGAVGFD